MAGLEFMNKLGLEMFFNETSLLRGMKNGNFNCR
jgi:hypothetical protein